MGQRVPVDGKAGAAEVDAAGQADARPDRQLAVFLVKIRVGHRFVDSLLQPAAGNSQVVDRPRVGLDRILLSHLGGIELQGLGNLVQLALDSETRLHRSVPALGAAGRLVGEDSATLEAIPGDFIGKGVERAGVVGGGDAVGAVGAAVERRAKLHGSDGAVLLHAGADPHLHRVPAAVAVKDLFAAETDEHRAA